LKTLAENVNLNNYSSFEDAAKAIDEAFGNFKERSYHAIRRTLTTWVKNIFANYDEAAATGILKNIG
jgi:hypothetical protein